MMCQRIGRPPISTIGFGRTSVSSASRVPSPPARITTLTDCLLYPGRMIPTNEHSPKDPTKISAMAADRDVGRLARELFDSANGYDYSYNFSWLGRPVIQYP